MITIEAFSSKPEITFPKPDGRMLIYQLVQGIDQKAVVSWDFLIGHYRTGQRYYFAGPTDT